MFLLRRQEPAVGVLTLLGRGVYIFNMTARRAGKMSRKQQQLHEINEG